MKIKVSVHCTGFQRDVCGVSLDLHALPRFGFSSRDQAPQPHQLSPNSHAPVTPRALCNRMIFQPPLTSLLLEVWKSAPWQAGRPHTRRRLRRCSGQRPKLTYCMEDGERKMGDENSPNHGNNWTSIPKDCLNASHSSSSTQTVNWDYIFGYFSLFFSHLANSCWQYLLRGFPQLYLHFHVLFINLSPANKEWLPAHWHSGRTGL